MGVREAAVVPTYAAEIAQKTCETCPARALSEAFWATTAQQDPFDAANTLNAIRQATADGKITPKEAVYDVHDMVAPIIDDDPNTLKRSLTPEGKMVFRCLKKQLEQPCAPNQATPFPGVTRADGARTLLTLLQHTDDLSGPAARLRAVFEDIASSSNDPDNFLLAAEVSLTSDEEVIRTVAGILGANALAEYPEDNQLASDITAA